MTAAFTKETEYHIAKDEAVELGTVAAAWMPVPGGDRLPKTAWFHIKQSGRDEDLLKTGEYFFSQRGHLRSRRAK